MREIIPNLWMSGSMRPEFNPTGFVRLVDMAASIPDDANGLGKEVFMQVERMSRVVADGVRRGEKTLVFCQAGENRSGLMCALVLRHFDYSTAAAIARVREKVPPITQMPHVLWNPGFVRELHEYLS